MPRISKLIVMALGLIAFACTSTQKTVNENVKQDRLDGLPENIWLSAVAQSRVDSLFMLTEKAHNQLINGDTLGAELSYEFAFDLMTRFNDSERQTLTGWSRYDSALTTMNDDYERIFKNQQELVEAEEVREDISDLEESTFPDSVLFGDMTVVDSSGAMPITLNKKVRLAIQYFQTKGRSYFSKVLERSGRYENMIRAILEEHEVPLDLAYLPIIESGYNPSARSYAKAVGMWQFIYATGRHYGLRSNWWFDERRDPVKATVAAARHLNDLHDRFGDWYLALAGYNCNPNRVARNMRSYNTRDFWKLSRLPRQTRNYVPTYLAATIIARDPKKFGFYVDKQPPLELDTVIVSESIDLNVVAKAVDTTYNFIKEINPAVLRWVTPPGVQDFTLYLPSGTKERFKSVYASLPDSEKRSWVRHKIRYGETLSTIAQKYHTSISVIKSTNNMRGNLIRAGHHLLIPVPQNKAHYNSYVSSGGSSYSSRPKKKSENSAEYEKVSYRVKKGDTLGGIAELFNTRASRIRAWNGLRYGSYIYPDQNLTIYVPKGRSFASNSSAGSDEKKTLAEGTYHTVRPGDTLWDISRRYNISISKIKQLNNMRSSVIKPGDKLIIQSN